MRKFLLVCTALIASLPAGAAVRVVRGGFGFGPAFGPWGYGYGYGYAPYGYAGVYSNAGEVKLETHMKDAAVFINGAYAGVARNLKTMWLRQGQYDLEIRAAGSPPFQQRIYVVNGKTLHVRPEMQVETRQ